jgi:putative efflux protein, MATE family
MSPTIVREKAFYKSLLAIALPIAMQNLIMFAINMADTVMLGRLGEVYLSASTLANQAGFIFLLFIFGVGSGTNVMAAQYYGKGEIQEIHRVMALMYRLVCAGGVVFVLLAQIWPQQIMQIFSTDAEVIAQGARFLRVVSLSYLPAGISSATMIVQRSVGNVGICVAVYLASLLTNVLGNWILIFGNLGAPALGIEGAAIATVIARCVEMVIALGYVLCAEKKLRFRLAYLRQPVRRVLPEYIRTAFPVIFNELLWGLGASVIAVVIGRLGTAATAAYSITSVLGQLVTITIFGVGNAAAVLIGNTVGAGEYERAKEYARTMLVIALLLGIIGALVVLLLKDFAVSLYNITPLARAHAGQMLYVYAGMALFKSLAAVSLIGVLRGGGDSRFVLVMDVVFMWTISIPLAYFAGHVWGAPVWIVYLAVQIDEVLKSLAGITRVLRGRWINDITLK